MLDYRYPSWRRTIFAAVLVIVVVIAFSPSVSHGTVTLRLYGSSARSVVNHVYVSFTRVELHEAGLPSTTGWVAITKGLSQVDLVSSNQTMPQTVTSTSVHSGRYDGIMITFSTTTLVIAGKQVPVTAPPIVKANFTLPVPPNSTGDVFLALDFDYSGVFANPPSLSLIVLQVSAV